MSQQSSPIPFSGHHIVRPSKTKSVDVGKPLGVYDTNSVHDRVRQWQAQGGGVVTADDVGEEESPRLANSSSKIRTPKQDREARTPSKSELESHNSFTPSRSGRSSVRVEEDKNSRTRSRSAPAKRIVSDGHWKRRRSPPKSTTSPKTAKTSSPTNVQAHGTRRMAKISEYKVNDYNEACNEIKEEASPKKDGLGGGDGIRVYITPPGSRKRSTRSHGKHDDIPKRTDERESNPEDEQRSQQRGSCDRRKRSTPERTRQTGSSEEMHDSGNRRRSAQRAADADELLDSKKGVLSASRGSTRSQKSNILNQVFRDSRKKSSKQEADIIPTPRVPSIETWLNETSDPFIEGEEPPVEYIAPLKPLGEARKSVPPKVTSDEVEDPNRIWDALDTKEGTRRIVSKCGRRKRIPSSAIYEDNPFPDGFESDTGLSASGKGTTSASKLVDLVKESPETSPTTLKRRSARKSVSSPGRHRRRSRILDHLSPDYAAASCLSFNDVLSTVGGNAPCNPNRPPGLSSERPIPSNGQHRLSTIASVETFSTKSGNLPPSNLEHSQQIVQPTAVGEDEAAGEGRDYFDPNSLRQNSSRLTKHADLISVLSSSKPGARSIQSARSIRTNRSRLATATVEDLMQELASDESKYMRELRTLVDGVIPVLLTCVLSKSDSAVAAGLFRPSANTNEDPNFTRPIVDMGIALERLKTLHKRIPQDNPAALLTWAHGAQRVYAEYLKAWRMGFQDVVVNLAPATNSQPTGCDDSSLPPQGLDQGLPLNEDGDVVNGEGERVDVAFLLKRPLVRLKYLQKTLNGINFLKPSSEAELLATKYKNLVNDARTRSNEERARLEDEAASNIDPTRTRDPKTLAPVAGVAIDRTRRVRARDNFELGLQHSSGQCMDCHVELIFRDEPSDTEEGGDLLICEVDVTGKWLLFPPIQFGRVSARNGGLKGEIVVMIRGINNSGSEWQELLSLRTEDEKAGFEWVQMLGLTPIPPSITRSQSFVNKRSRRKFTTKSTLATQPDPISPTKSRTPSPREVEVPIGEQANDCSKAWAESFEDGLTSRQSESPRRRTEIEPSSPVTFSKSSNYVEKVNDLRSLPSQKQTHKLASDEPTRTPRSFKEALGLSGTGTTVGLKRTRAKRQSRHVAEPPSSPKSSPKSTWKSTEQDFYPRETHEIHTRRSDTISKSQLTTAPTEFVRQLDRPLTGHDSGAVKVPKDDTGELEKDTRPPNQRSRASVPSMELPFIPKARQKSPLTSPTFAPEEEPEWPSAVETTHGQSPSKPAKKRPVTPETEAQPDALPPATPAHRSPSPVQLGGTKTPVLPKTQTRPRRSSSPLKHEYEPSTASESSSDSDASTVERKGTTSISDSSEEGDAPTPLLPLGALKRLSNAKPSLRPPLQSTADGSIKPSESASQAPYKKVPAQPTKATKTIASIFSWSDTGAWQSLHPDECSIVITPGLIEAFEMSAAHSKDVPLSSPIPIIDTDAFSDLASNVTSQNDDVRGDRPLIALELTPLVPLRRGTALDISIRSPPTSNSQITSGTNIMFRSRNPEECEALYALINHSRINNPTFIALQNARASGSSFTADRRACTSGTRSKHSWFGGWGRSSSYRASSAPTPSIAPSDSSIGSMSSAFSALRRFGRGGGGMFNISRSTIISREGSRANSVYTGSENSSGSGTSSPLPPESAGNNVSLGLSNVKIRLYVRESASKWRDMGSARLTIMRPEKMESEQDGMPANRSEHQIMKEKRIIINGKTKGEVLLDVQLGESRFERVARTGIALSVWEDVVGPNGEVGVVGAIGGVSGGRASVYMIQMKSEAETAYTFSIVGKLRY